MRWVLLLAIICVPWALPALAQTQTLSLARERPECVSFTNGRLDCLARDRKGHFVWTVHDGRKWSQPRLLLGRFSGPASCVVRGPFGLNCFAIGADGTLWHIAMNGGQWRGWRPLGGRLAISRPSCVAPARNQILCFAKAQSGELTLKAWYGDETWQEWRGLGGQISGDPSCVRLSFERAACFWRRRDGLFSGYFPSGAGPGGAILTLPRDVAQPSCASLGGDQALCFAVARGGQLFEWRGDAVLGGVGLDGAAMRPFAGAKDPFCASRSSRVICTYLGATGGLFAVEATPDGLTAPVLVANRALFGRCAVFDTARLACTYLTPEGALQVAFREDQGKGLTGPMAAILPVIAEKPAIPATLPTATPTMALGPEPSPATALAPLATVSAKEPLGAWRVFEPRTGLYCQITLFDAPARPYRSLTREPDCDRLQSLRGVSRWSAEKDGIYLRDARGRVFFRFSEAGPTALRARWRRNDLVMMARDLKAFAIAAPPGAPSSPGQAPAMSVAHANVAQSSSGSVVGVWRLRMPGRRPCVVRLTIDADSAETRTRVEGCSGAFASVDGWSVRRGALVLERGGVPVARFVEGRGVVWRGQYEGRRPDGRRGGLIMVKQ